MTLSDDINLNQTGATANNHSVFAYDSKTEYVVIELKENNNDVSSIRTGDISDIVAKADAADGLKDMTGVYVMTVDNDQDTTPLATSILVVVPYVK